MLGRFMHGNTSKKTASRPPVPSDDSLASETPIFVEGLDRTNPDPRDRIVAGALSEAEFRLATIGAAEVIKQAKRTNRALRNDAPGAKFKRHHAPLNLIGGYKFSNTPEIDGVGEIARVERAFPAFAESRAP
jgi:hypothetical protein